MGEVNTRMDQIVGILSILKLIRIKSNIERDLLGDHWYNLKIIIWNYFMRNIPPSYLLVRYTLQFLKRRNIYLLSCFTERSDFKFCYYQLLYNLYLVVDNYKGDDYTELNIT